MFIHTSSHGRTLLLFVDDMIVNGDDFDYIAFVKARLSEQFFMSNLGPVYYFHGIEVSSTSKGIYLSQEKYIQDLLARPSLTYHRTIETPIQLSFMPLTVNLSLI